MSSTTGSLNFTILHSLILSQSRVQLQVHWISLPFTAESYHKSEFNYRPIEFHHPSRLNLFTNQSSTTGPLNFTILHSLIFSQIRVQLQDRWISLSFTAVSYHKSEFNYRPIEFHYPSQLILITNQSSNTGPLNFTILHSLILSQIRVQLQAHWISLSFTANLITNQSSTTGPLNFTILHSLILSQIRVQLQAHWISLYFTAESYHKSEFSYRHVEFHYPSQVYLITNQSSTTGTLNFTILHRWILSQIRVQLQAHWISLSFTAESYHKSEFNYRPNEFHHPSQLNLITNQSSNTGPLNFTILHSCILSQITYQAPLYVSQFRSDIYQSSQTVQQAASAYQQVFRTSQPLYLVLWTVFLYILYLNLPSFSLILKTTLRVL